MTFVGLYMYDRAKMEVARGERKVQRIEFKEKHLLPLDTSDIKLSAPPTPTPFNFTIPPLSATSATEYDEPPRRRSSSFTDLQRPQLNGGAQGNWGLGMIKEMTPPVTPPLGPVRSEKGGKYIPNGSHRRRYSGSVHGIGVNGMLGGGKVVEKQYRPEGVEDKASWE
jgi:hypothetical protein